MIYSQSNSDQKKKEEEGNEGVYPAVEQQWLTNGMKGNDLLVVLNTDPPSYVDRSCCSRGSTCSSRAALTSRRSRPSKNWPAAQCKSRLTICTLRKENWNWLSELKYIISN